MINCRSSNICIKCYQFPSEHCFNCIPQIVISCVFSFNSKYSLIYFEISFLIHMLFINVLFNIHIFYSFFINLWLLISSLIPFFSKGRHSMISILLNLLKHVLWPRNGPSWWMFHVSLGRMCILRLLGEVVYRHQLYTID